MKISTIKTTANFKRVIIAFLMLCLSVLALSACGKKGNKENKPTGSNASGTVSIYYKDDVSSKVIYDDIISDKEPSADGNLADDATPELIIPSDKTPGESSSKISGTSSGSVSSTDSPQNASSSIQQGAVSSEESSSQSSSTSSHDKGYTKPY